MKAPFAVLSIAALVAASSSVTFAEVEKEKVDAKDQEQAKPELDGAGSDGFQQDVLDEGRKNLEEIQRLLDEVQNDLSNQQTGQGTQSKQQSAVKKMTSLIDKLVKACQQGQPSGEGGGKPQPTSGQQPKDGSEGQGQKPGSKRQQQNQLSSEKQKGGQKEKGQGEPKDQQQGGSKPEDQETDSPGKVPNNAKADGSAPESGKANPLVDKLRKSKRWGTLPDKIREQMLSAGSKEAPSEYRDIIERYYRRISEFYDKKNR